MTDAELWQGLADRLKPYIGTVSSPPSAPVSTPVFQPPAPPAAPVPAISDRWSKAPSQWAKWMFITTSEQIALAALYGTNIGVNQHINWYQSYHRLDGRQLPDGSYVFVDGYVGGVPQWAPDVGGAADRKHKADLRNVVPEIEPLG